MNFNNFTIKSQEAIQQAVQLVSQHGQQSIEAAHLMKAVIMSGESVVNFLFQKLGVNVQNLNQLLERQIDSYPTVSGGEPYLSGETNSILQKAIDYCSKMGDQYVSLEHIILALFTEKSVVSQMLKDAGVTAYSMSDIDRQGFASVLKKISVFFKSRVDVVHVSFDMDVIDPMYAPGVGIPLPGGLNYREALLLMEEMAGTGMVCSAEFVEVNPVLDVRSQTALMAVELIARLLGDTI